MDIKYQTYMPRLMSTGTEINLNGCKWLCFVNCTLVGATIEKSLPVIIGPGTEDTDPRIARECEMRRAEDCQSPPKSGRTGVENDILSQYKRIPVEELVGKNIVVSKLGFEQILIITDGKCYVNLEPHNSYGDMELIDEELDLGDLKNSGLLEDGVWREHQREKQLMVDMDRERCGTLNLNQVVRTLGRAKVLELLNKPVS